MILNRSNALFVAVLVMLSLLGGTLAHAEAAPCPHGPHIAHGSYAGHHFTADSRTLGTAGDKTCGGFFCPMAGCCFPQPATAEFSAPATASSELPRLLATNGSGTRPAEADHPPKTA